jgi:outer membrane protein TolC
MRICIFGLVVTLLSLFGAVASADDLGSELPKPAQAMPEPNESTGATAVQLMALSLDRAVELALENNLDVEVQRFAPLISGEREREAWGAYDPESYAEFGYADIDNPSSFTLDGQVVSVDRSASGTGGFQGLLPYLGSRYDFSFSGSRATTNSTVQSLTPELRSSFSLNLAQPLLRGLIWNEPWTRVKTTRVLYDESLEEFRRRVMDTVQEVEDGYWNLIATGEQKRVAEKSLETARALLEQTQTQYEVGVVSKVEVVESEAGVADRDFNLIVAENRYQSAQDFLINLILGTDFTADSTIKIEPTDRPDDYITYEIDAESATQRAFAHRPELAIADDEIERQKLELKFAKNSRLPKLDIEVGYGNRGIAGDRNPDSCAFVADDPVLFAACLEDPSKRTFGDTLDDFLGDRATEQFTARALFSIPIPNTAARSKVSQGELSLRRAITEKRRLEQNIILEVRKAVRDLESSQEGIEAAQRASAASAEQLRAERIRLEYGDSTPFDVLQREEDFVQAESREIDALRSYRISVTGLNRAEGSILTDRNIAIDQISSVR